MENLEGLRRRAIFADSDHQHDRMIRDKIKAFHRALLYSYQTGWVKKDYDLNPHWCRALINANKLVFDYDEKIISVDAIEQFVPGDSFEWPQGSNIHWLIYQQELTELGYFRGACRKCQELVVQDDDGLDRTIWMAVRGPVETELNKGQKDNLAFHNPNLTLHCYVPCTKQNLKLFQRYFKFKFANKYWQVVAYDEISTSGVIEFTARENFDCCEKDTLYEVKDPNLNSDGIDVSNILGSSFTKPFIKERFTVGTLQPGAEWTVELANNRKNVKNAFTVDKIESNIIEITWTATVSGSYTVKYGDLAKTVIVESLF